MPTLPIPFTSLNKAVDKYSQAFTYGQLQQDGYWHPNHGPDGPRYMWVKRPGKTLLKNLGETGNIQGLKFWPVANVLLAVTSGGKVFSVAGAATQTDLTGTATISGSSHNIEFDEAATPNAYVCGVGTNIAKFTTTAASGADLADAQAPTGVMSLGVLNNCLVALNAYNSSRADYSAAGTFDTWDGEYITASSRAGAAHRMLSHQGFLFFFKGDNIEVFSPTDTGFQRAGYGTIDIGIKHGYTAVALDGMLFWVDQDFNVRRMDGFNHRVISTPVVTEYLKNQDISALSHTKAFPLKVDGKRFYILRVSGGSVHDYERSSLVYDIDLDQWYQWGTWDAGNDRYDYFNVNCVANPVNTNNDGDSHWEVPYIGADDNDDILSFSGTTDNGTAIRSAIRTDFIDRGLPDKYKFCNELMMLFKRPYIASGTPKQISIKYRDNGSTTFSTAIAADIEAVSTTELLVRFRRLGRYLRRQWEFINATESSAAIIGAWETFDIGI